MTGTDLEGATEEQLAIAARGTQRPPAPGESSTLDPELVALRRAVAELANLYVTCHRLGEAKERGDVMTVLTEVVISLVGSERFVFVERGHDEGGFVATCGFGLSGAELEAVLRQGERLDGFARSVDSASGGEFALSDASTVPVTAMVPIGPRGAARGVLIVFEMLPHKPNLEAADWSLLELLSTHVDHALRAVDALSATQDSPAPPREERDS